MAVILLRRSTGGNVEDGLGPPVALALGATVGGLLLFLTFEVNGRTYEGHRFMTAARTLVPMAALLYLPRLPRASFASLVLLLPMLAGVLVTLGFVFYRLPVKPDTRGGEDQYVINCRDDMGARLGDPIVPTYADESLWHLYAGCRPIFAPGHEGNPGVVLAGWPMLGPPGFAKMNRAFFSPGQPARVVCPREPSRDGPVCAKARATTVCVPQGEVAVTCEVPPRARPWLETP
jgi:hypothetical protein